MAGRFLYRKIVHRLLQINDTPESIALGAAVGMWLAFTPTVGIQMILMIIIGTVIRANRLAGVIMVYISNPLTLLPIYWSDYYVGAVVLGRELRDRSWFISTCERFLEQVESAGPWHASVEFLQTQGEIAWPMAVGGAVIGLVLALPTYPITLRLVRAHQRRKLHRQSLQTLRAIRSGAVESDSRRVLGSSPATSPSPAETGELEAGEAPDRAHRAPVHPPQEQPEK